MKSKISNKKYKTFLIYLVSLYFMELVFSLFIYDSYSRSTIINVILFLIPISGLITIITSIFNDKVNRIITYIIFIILAIWYSTSFVFLRVFDSYFSISLFGLSDQALQFGKVTLISILQNSYVIILFFVPVILMIIFRKKINFNRNRLKQYLLFIGIVIISSLLFILNIYLQKDKEYSIYDLYLNINDNSLNVEKLGVLNAALLDIERIIFGFEEKISLIDTPKIEEDEEEIFEYDYNTLDIDFDTIVGNNSVNTISNYMKNDLGTKQNKYTSLFEGKNLIYFVAESFSDIGVSEELTPTLYKLTNTGFVFNNFYTSNNASTIGGEFQALTGLYANTSFLSRWRSGSNSFPYGLAKTFTDLGYNTYAYHNHYYNFQDRNIYLKSLGFNNYKGCYNGMEKIINCDMWPESDVEMINATIGDYLNSDKPFVTYYMTVSGHFEYDWYNAMSKKHKDAVINLNYSDSVKAYLATQIELDKALELLIQKLEEVNKLDDTVIVLLADHYPYALSLSEMNEVANYTKDSVIEVNRNKLILWNNKLKTIEIDKVSMSIDVIPTVYNLFGIKYDSRLFMGKDILSSEEGLAIFKNRSWVTNKGTYYAANGSYTNDMSSDYIASINAKVSNRMNLSKLIVETNYYSYIK